VPFEAKKIPVDLLSLFLFFFFRNKSKISLLFLSSPFFTSVFFCWTSLFSSISSPLALFLLSSRFGGGGGGGRFCPSAV
jgi:hypothetical protein